MRKGLSMSHFGSFPHDIEMMEDFYADIFGFTVTDRGVSPERTIVFLSRDPDEHHQTVLATGRPADLQFNVINPISLRADSLATLKELHGRLSSDAVSPMCNRCRTETHSRSMPGIRRAIALSWSSTCPTTRISRAGSRSTWIDRTT